MMWSIAAAYAFTRPLSFLVVAAILPWRSPAPESWPMISDWPAVATW